MGKGLKEAVELLERGMILEALKKCRGVQARAAMELRISERVLRYKIRKYGLKVRTKLSYDDGNVVDANAFKNP
jgi:DNA-binding NtrC family response regulator